MRRKLFGGYQYATCARKINSEPLNLLSDCVSMEWLCSLFILSAGNDSKIRVACVGDSITGGTSYPLYLARLLGSSFMVGNFGVAGTTASLDSGGAYIEQKAFQDAKKFQPNIVIIMLGTNDANSTLYPDLNEAGFVEGCVQLIREFQALSAKPKIYLVKPPPVFNGETGTDAQYFRDFVLAGIEQVAAQTKLALIDVYSVLADYSDFFPDGVHPDNEGAQLIADEIYKAIIVEN
jgi:acyl-CoA thioesterase I